MQGFRHLVSITLLGGLMLGLGASRPAEADLICACAQVCFGGATPRVVTLTSGHIKVCHQINEEVVYEARAKCNCANLKSVGIDHNTAPPPPQRRTSPNH